MSGYQDRIDISLELASDLHREAASLERCALSAVRMNGAVGFVGEALRYRQAAKLITRAAEHLEKLVETGL